jgi:transposase
VQVAKFAQGIWRLDDGHDAVFPMGQKRGLVEDFDDTSKVKDRGGKSGLYGCHNRASSPGCRRGPEKRGDQALGRSRGGFGSKIHVIVDGQKRLLAIRLTPGNVSDFKCAEELIKEAARFKPETLAADKGYDSNSIRDLLRRKHIGCCIPTKCNRKRQIPHNPDIYRLRSKVEHYFGHLKEFRRVSTRYDKKASSFFNLVIIATLVMFLKTIC